MGEVTLATARRSLNTVAVRLYPRSARRGASRPRLGITSELEANASWRSAPRVVTPLELITAYAAFANAALA